MFKNELGRVAIGAALISGAALAHALPVTVKSDKAGYAPGDLAVFTVIDDQPRQMFDAINGAIAADFFLGYDPATFGFVSIAYPVLDLTALIVQDNSQYPPAGSVNVSIVGFSEADLPESASALFEVTFLVKSGVGTTQVTLDGGEVPPYAFVSTPVDVRITSAVPEPSTYALMAAGLAGIGFAARRRQRRTA